jgi:hypothetical protein
VADDGLRALEAQLGGRAPAGIRRLDEERLRDLADALADARHRQAAELAAAGERAFGHIPRLLRGPVRKVLG